MTERQRGRTWWSMVVLLTVAALLASSPTPAWSDGRADADVREAQILLNDLGFPVGPIDGMDGPQTRRGLCAWRRLGGHEVHRGPLTAAELDDLRAAEERPNADAGRGLTVDKTCQTVYYREDGEWIGVFAASSGRGGLPRHGDYEVKRKRVGWHTSTLYPAPLPNMYNTMYFSGVIAIHGSRFVPARPVSAGCVRVHPSDADFLFARMRLGDPISVIGTF